jgi:hypothetical protein
MTRCHIQKAPKLSMVAICSPFISGFAFPIVNNYWVLAVCQPKPVLSSPFLFIKSSFPWLLTIQDMQHSHDAWGKKQLANSCTWCNSCELHP